MKNKLIWFIKAFVAGLITFGIVSGICFFYYNLPMHYTNKSGATDYLWDKNHISIRGTEGFAWTETDENGFVNTFPDKKDIIDVLVMGSSHAESFNVDSDESFTYLLNKKFKENGYDKYVYNIGTSSHELVRCLRNLDDAINEYKPTDYVVIETLKLNLRFDEIKELHDGTLDYLDSYESGLIYYLQKSDFLRLLYAQAVSFMNQNKETADGKQVADETDWEEYEYYLDKVMQKVAATAQKNGVKIIIVYSPEMAVDYDGKIIKSPEEKSQQIFKKICREYGVECIDMFSQFEKMYNETYSLPHGFSNTATGKGHTNKYGHACIADTLYDCIVEG